MSKENSTPTEKLFGSKTRAKLLQLFFENPEKSFYVREMARVIDEQINSVRRGIDIIKKETFDNKIYYSANKKHPFSHAMIEIFAKKDGGKQEKETKESICETLCRPVKNYLSGLVVTNRLPGQDGVDLLIIGDDRTKKLTRWAEVIEKKQGKPINYVIMSPEDFVYRKSVRDRFVMDVMEMEITEIVDPEKIIKER